MVEGGASGWSRVGALAGRGLAGLVVGIAQVKVETTQAGIESRAFHLPERDAAGLLADVDGGETLA